jgi:periplasmic protein TonB
MKQVLLTVSFLGFISFMAQAQPGFADSVGTIYVKKKKANDTIIEENRPVEDVFIITENMPEFPSALAGMTVNQFIAANYVVPQEAFNKGISGTVYVSFVVDTDGTLKDIEVGRGVPGCRQCDEEALRVMRLMPAWIPGTQGGVPVPVKMSIPVKFRFNQ